MISSQAIGALRVAATLTHALPQIRTRVRVDDEVVLRVQAREDGNGGSDGPPVISPCEFRGAVARAHVLHGEGRRMGFAGVPADQDPSIDIATGASGTARPGGLYRVPAAGRWLWGFGTTLDLDTAIDVSTDLVGESHVPGVRALGIRHDCATEVTLAYAETQSEPGSAGEAHLIDILESLMARWTAEALVACVASSAVTGNGSRVPGPSTDDEDRS